MNRRTQLIIQSLIIISISIIIVVTINRFEKVKLPFERLETVVINEILVENIGGLKDSDGDYTAWVELYNYGDSDINLSTYGLTNDLDNLYLWRFPEDTIINSQQFLLIKLSGKNKIDLHGNLHSNFTLSSNDAVYNNQLALTHPNGEIIDNITIPKLKENTTYGTVNKDLQTYAILSQPTPEAFNTVEIIDSSKIKKLESPVFSHEAGYYSSNFKLELTTDDEDCLIFYTLDGSTPNENSLIYTSPIEISYDEEAQGRLSSISTTVYDPFKIYKNNDIYLGTIVRARTYKDGTFSEEVITKSYFINPNYSLPIISIVTDSDNLFGYDNGIYIPGAIYDKYLKENNEDNIFPPANFTQRGKSSERPAHIEFFNKEGNLLLNQNVGIRVSGSASRYKPAKSLAIYARTKYDESPYINYPLFDDLYDKEGKQIDSYKTLKLRNSGQDFNLTMFQDALMQSLVSETNLLTQAYLPTIVFINGEYWGIHNLREKVDEYYISSHYNVEKDNITIIGSNAFNMELEYGKESVFQEYLDLVEFAETNDLSVQQNYLIVEEKLDIESYIEYFVAEIYFANIDWPHNNMKLWRPNIATDSIDTKWRPILFDTDAGYGNSSAWEDNSYESDTFNRIFEISPEWSTSLFKNLLKNQTFREQFYNKFCLFLDTIFHPDIALEKVIEMAQVIEPEIEEHLSRWENQFSSFARLCYKLNGEDIEDYIWDIDDWDREVYFMRQFSYHRPKYIREYLDNYFSDLK